MSPNFQVSLFYYRPYPGNDIAEQLFREGYRFPQTLEEWAMFDYVGAVGPWVNDGKFALVERFKFYQKHAYGPAPSLLRWPLRTLSRWRVENEWYRFPVEKTLVEWLRPPQPLS
jgi:hypothetical protein